MPAVDTISPLTAFEGRGPGTDAERRAAHWLKKQLAGGGRSVRIEPFWCRPNWALGHAWHALLGLAGGLVSVSDPTAGGLMVLAALGCLIADATTGVSPGRRLTSERASQNVVAEPANAPTAGARSSAGQGRLALEDRVRLIVTANYDAGRMGLAYRDGARRAAARLRHLTGERGPGWLGWLAAALIWLLAVTLARMQGSRGTTIGLLQLAPTVALVLGFALLLELAGAPVGPAASDNASGVAVAIALARALDAAPPRALRVDLVLAGAGEGGAVGLRRYLRARRREPGGALILAIAACGGGSPRWWRSDGPLIPLAYNPRLRELAAEVARAAPGLRAAPYRGRGTTPAFPARLAGLPAIAIGSLDARGLPPRSHQPADTAAALERGAVDATLELALMLVDAIDAEVAAAREDAAGAEPSLTRG